MTKDKKREYNETFWKRKRAAGWRFFGFILPPLVADRVQDFKRKEMAKYHRGERAEA